MLRVVIVGSSSSLGWGKTALQRIPMPQFPGVSAVQTWYFELGIGCVNWPRLSQEAEGHDTRSALGTSSHSRHAMPDIDRGSRKWRIDSLSTAN